MFNDEGIVYELVEKINYKHNILIDTFQVVNDYHNLKVSYDCSIRDLNLKYNVISNLTPKVNEKDAADYFIKTITKVVGNLIKEMKENSSIKRIAFYLIELDLLVSQLISMYGLINHESKLVKLLIESKYKGTGFDFKQFEEILESNNDTPF